MTIYILILIFLIMPVSFAADGDFTIPSANIDVTVNDDASIVVTEQIVYDIEGSITGVYREIPVNDNQEITDISVETPGFYNTVKIEDNDSINIKVWLYADSDKSQKLENEKVTVIYTYTISNAVNMDNDNAELHLLTWGNEWNSEVDHLESNIHIPGSNENVEYRNTPEDYVVSSEWTSSDTLTTKVDNIPPYTAFRQMVEMPKSSFNFFAGLNNIIS